MNYYWEGSGYAVPALFISVFGAFLAKYKKSHVGHYYHYFRILFVTLLYPL